jgi:hypothetical protein
MIKKRATFLKKYIEFELIHGRTPNSVFEFCKENKTDEATFYEFFNSLTQLRKAILTEQINNTLSILDESEDYAAYSAREKVLALFYTQFEQFKSIRSYLIEKYQDKNDVKNNVKDWDDYFNQFQARIEGILVEAKQTEEVQDRPYIGEHYAKGFKIGFTYVFRVWLKDESQDFETTDAAIEKTINLAFDMLGVSPLDSLLDFGRFAIKTKVF